MDQEDQAVTQDSPVSTPTHCLSNIQEFLVVLVVLVVLVGLVLPEVREVKERTVVCSWLLVRSGHHLHLQDHQDKHQRHSLRLPCMSSRWFSLPVVDPQVPEGSLVWLRWVVLQAWERWELWAAWAECSGTCRGR
jgi:hypothetical protein